MKEEWIWGSKKPTLTQVFDGYIEDTVTDEQVQKVLEPVLRLIRTGAFNRPRKLFDFGGRIKARPVESLFRERIS